MKTIGICCVKVVMAALSVVAIFSAETAHGQEAPRWVGPTLIKEIVVQPNGNLMVWLDASTPDLGCTGNDDGYLSLNPAFPYFKEQFSLLLAAHTASRPVRVYAMGCGYYPYAQNVRLQ